MYEKYTMNYGELIKAIESKPFAEMMQDLENRSKTTTSYITEIDSVIKSGNIPNIPDTFYTPKPVGPIHFLKHRGLETTTDVANDDIQQILFQQNTMYIMGTITCATLILSAIYFARE